jgi:hypothetical protein
LAAHPEFGELPATSITRTTPKGCARVHLWSQGSLLLGATCRDSEVTLDGRYTYMSRLVAFVIVAISAAVFKQHQIGLGRGG